jgi:hypothetical protein
MLKLQLSDEPLLSFSFDSLREDLQQSYWKLKQLQYNNQIQNHFLELFIKEADQGDEQCCYVTALCYFRSIGIEQNFKKMKFYAKKIIKISRRF